MLMIKQNPRCGAIVTTKIGKFTGIITAELKRFGKTQYEVTYINENQHTIVWLYKQEFTLYSDKKLGF